MKDLILADLSVANQKLMSAASAKDIVLLKQYCDVGEAAKNLTKKRNMSLEVQNNAAEFTIMAEWELGKIIPEKFPKGKPKRSHHVTLKDVGISKMQSHRYKQISTIPKKEIKDIIVSKRASKEHVIQSEFLKLAKVKKREKNIEKEKEKAEKSTKSGEWSVKKRNTVTIGLDKELPYDLMVTDPPYGILKNESWEPTASELKTVTSLWASKWNYCRADFICTFWSQRYLWEGREWFDDSFKDYKFQQLLIWNYPNNKKPQSRQMFKQSWEPIFLYRRKDSKKAIGEQAGEWGGDLHFFDCHTAATPQSNFNAYNQKQHPAQKPLSVFRWLINALSAPGDRIVDPFCGSGTSGIAAVQLGRKYQGYDNDADYVKLSERRIKVYGRV